MVLLLNNLFMHKKLAVLPTVLWFRLCNKHLLLGRGKPIKQRMPEEGLGDLSPMAQSVFVS